MKNISNQNSSIVLREKYLNKNNPQFEDLKELFQENFLKENEKLIMNYHYNERRNFMKSSATVKKKSSFNVGIGVNKNSDSRIMSSNQVNGVNIEHRRVKSMGNNKILGNEL